MQNARRSRGGKPDKSILSLWERYGEKRDHL